MVTKGILILKNLQNFPNQNDTQPIDFFSFFFVS
jgi:hypothetical protein